MNLFKDLQNQFHDFIHSLRDTSLGFVHALAESIAANGGKVLQDAAVAAVNAAETTGATGSEKFDAAYVQVIGVLEAEGLPILVSAVKGAIEAAVANLRAPAVPAA